MEYRKLKEPGQDVSLLGFGCMRFPTLPDGLIDRQKAVQLLDKAYRGGVNYFDTAYTYHNGESERFIGDALSAYDRSSYYVADKLPCWAVHSPEDAQRIFAEQLSRLNMPYIDCYLLHALNKQAWDEMTALGIPEYLQSLKEEGKIRFLGFSFHDDYPVFEEILCSRDWDFCQIQLNYMDTDEQAGLKGYRLAVRRGVPVIVMEPVKGGLLASLPEAAASLKRLDPRRSDASWALRWAADFPGVKIVLSGMTTMEQVEDNLDTFSETSRLTPEERRAVAETAEMMKSRVYNGCTGCRYCMPCPYGVDIPHNFSIWNAYGVYRNAPSVKWQWKHGIGESKRAARCTECGACETACPQKISIRADLRRVQSELERIAAEE